MSDLKLVLASSSEQRKKILSQLAIPFKIDPANIDESRIENENAKQMVKRLSYLKAKALEDLHPNSLIIGSDEVAELDGEVYGKSYTFEKAKALLTKASGKQMKFYTGLCVINTNTRESIEYVDNYSIFFKILTDESIENYLEQDKPYYCAGSIKIECLAPCLIDKMQGDDYNSLLGLPLIKLIEILKGQGINLP